MDFDLKIIRLSKGKKGTENMFCVKCGRRVDSQRNFCSSCGAGIDSQSAESDNVEELSDVLNIPTKCGIRKGERDIFSSY